MTTNGGLSKSFPPGTYTVIMLAISDIAGNTNIITDPNAISQILGGETTITVTK